MNLDQLYIDGEYFENPFLIIWMGFIDGIIEYEYPTFEMVNIAAFKKAERLGLFDETL